MIDGQKFKLCVWGHMGFHGLGYLKETGVVERIKIKLRDVYWYQKFSAWELLNNNIGNALYISLLSEYPCECYPKL